MGDAARECWGNPSSTHRVGRAARARVEDAREAVARLADRDPRDVVLTSGGTEANNIAVRAPFVQGGGVLVTSRLEHPSVVRVAEALERDGKARVRWVAVRPDGTIDLDDLNAALTREPDVRLVAIQAINSETGVVQPVADAIAIARGRGVRVHVDAVQAFGRDADTAPSAETRSLSGHKIRGPKGIGALVSSEGVSLVPVLVGGEQERGLRPGTLDPVAAAGLAVAARRALDAPARWAALASLRDELEHGILRLGAGARVLGGEAPRRAPHVTTLVFPGWAGAELVAALDLEGVAVSSGTACSAGTAAPSEAVAAMGDRAGASSSVRFSLGEETVAEDIAVAIGAVTRVLARARLE